MNFFPKSKMSVMRRDVNLGLLLLIVAALIMFSGFTVYYQTTFKNLSATYNNQLQELGKVTKDLEEKRGALNETSVQLQLRQQKEEDLSKKFTDVRSERDQFESDKKKLDADLGSTKSSLSATLKELENTKTELDSTKSRLAAEIQLAQDLNSQVLSLKADVDRINDLYRSYKSKYECVANKVDADGKAC